MRLIAYRPRVEPLARQFFRAGSGRDGVFHDDRVAPDPDGAPGLTDEAGAVQDPHARSNRDVAAQRRIGCHPGRRVDHWTLARMLDQHCLDILKCPRTYDAATALSWRWKRTS